MKKLIFTLFAIMLSSQAYSFNVTGKVLSVETYADGKIGVFFTPASELSGDDGNGSTNYNCGSTYNLIWIKDPQSEAGKNLLKVIMMAQATESVNRYGVIGSGKNCELTYFRNGPYK